MILYNGAFVRLGPQGEVLLRQGFSPRTRGGCEKLLAVGRSSPWCTPSWREGAGPLGARQGNTGSGPVLGSRQGDPRLLPAQEASLYEGEVFYFTCIGRREELLPAWEALRRGGGLRPAAEGGDLPAGEFWLEVMPAGATKANGARRLKEGLSCSSMVCFGDGLNDLPLLQAADHACAVANAVPELRAAADEVILPTPRTGWPSGCWRTRPPPWPWGSGPGPSGCGCTRPEDLEELVQLFYETVHTVNLGDYTREETDAWVPSPGGCGPGRLGGRPFRPLHRGGGRRGCALGFGDMARHRLSRPALVHREFQGRGRLPPLRRPWRVTPWAWAWGGSRSTPPARPALLPAAGLQDAVRPAGGAPGRAAGKLRHGRKRCKGGKTHGSDQGAAGPAGVLLCALLALSLWLTAQRQVLGQGRGATVRLYLEGGGDLRHGASPAPGRPGGGGCQPLL